MAMALAASFYAVSSGSAQDVAPFQMSPQDVAPADASAASSAPFQMLVQDVQPTGRTITYEGSESAGVAAITNNEDDGVRFTDKSTAANATIVNNSGGRADFTDNASGGSALIRNNSDSNVAFSGNSRADTADITNNGGGTVTFSDSASAGNAAIANNGALGFTGNSTAENSNIVNNATGSVRFGGRSSGGSGQINNNGSLEYVENSNAGTGLINNNQGATIIFSGNASALAVAITNNASLEFSDRSTAASAAILNNGTGTIGFSGRSTAGDAFIANSGGIGFAGSSSAGTSEIVNNATGSVEFDGNASLGTGAINNGGTLVFTGSSTAAAGRILTGPDGRTYFQKASSGGSAELQADLGGIVDFSGVTTAQIGVGSIAGPGSYYLGGVQLLVGANGQSTTVDGKISDGGVAGGSGGGIIKPGSGTLTLSGNNSYTGQTRVAGGVLQAGTDNGFSRRSALTVDAAGRVDLAGFDASIGSLAGRGSVDLVSGTLSTGFDGTSTVFAGNIEGTGGLIKVGSGVLGLSGMSTYSGPTEVRTGAIFVSGSIADSAFLVGANARLGGTGTIGATTIYGTLARASDGGTLSVDGDLTMGANSTYEIALDATQSAPLVSVGGEARINDGNVIVTPSGSFALDGARYTILSAAQITGQFSGIVDTYPFIEFDLVYDPVRVGLTVSRSDTGFADVGQTPNQRSVAAALDNIGMGEVFAAVVTLPNAEEARAAFDLLSGEAAVSNQGMLLENSRIPRDAATDRLNLIMASKAPAYGFWANALGDFAKVDGDGNAAPYKSNTGGVIFGTDALFSDVWSLGVLGGYRRTKLDVDDRLASLTNDTFHIGLYGGARWDAWSLLGGVIYSHHNIESERNVAFTGFSDRLEADYSANTLQVFGEAGYRMELGSLTVQPFAGLAYARLESDPFTERGGDAALSAQGTSTAIVVSTLGVRMSKDFGTAFGKGNFKAMLGWRHTSGDTMPNQIYKFALSEPFSIAGAPIAKNAAVLETGVNFDIVQNAKFGVYYSGQFGSGSSSHGIGARIETKF